MTKMIVLNAKYLRGIKRSAIYQPKKIDGMFHRLKPRIKQQRIEETNQMPIQHTIVTLSHFLYQNLELSSRSR